VERLTLEEIQPEMAAMVTRLRDSRPLPVGLESRLLKDVDILADPDTNADDDNALFSTDEAIRTMDRLKRQVSLSLRHEDKDKGKYTELLESTVLTFHTINNQLVQEINRLKKVDGKLDSVKIWLNQSSFSEKVRFNDLKRSTNQSMVQWGRKIEAVEAKQSQHLREVEAKVVLVVNDTLAELGLQKKAAQVLKADVSRQFKALNQSLDLGVKQMVEAVEAGAKGTEQLDQRLLKVSGDMNRTQQALNRTFDQLWSHFDSIKIAVVNGTTDHLKNVISHQGRRLEAALQNQSVYALESNGNRTRDLIQSMVMDQLYQWHVGLADKISAEFEAHHLNVSLNMDDLKTFVRERMAIVIAEAVGNRTRDLLDQSETRSQEWMSSQFQQIQANLTWLSNKFDRHEVILGSIGVAVTNHTELLDDCFKREPKKKHYSVFEQFQNIISGQIPEDSESFHFQSMSELISSESGMIGILSVIVWCFRVLDARGGSRLAKLCRLRQHWITKVCFMP
jgi:hypothetical protein